ncbi:MAG: hypothetical protein DRP87_01835 [Spirochaetes bacterium]|nr:MAG: hypothetical protein DRP87_01835 [Spirochaetota bacterium]
MKRKIIAFFAVTILSVLTVSLFADTRESNLYVKSLHIVRVYPHKKGFQIVYRKNNMELREFYVPNDWFKGAGSKGDLIWGDGREFPYCSIFWKDGEFEHIRLYLHKDLNHESWGGILESNEQTDEMFENIETLDLDF